MLMSHSPGRLETFLAVWKIPKTDWKLYKRNSEIFI